MPPPFPIQKHKASLAARLTFYYVLTSCLVLCIVAGALYWILTSSLKRLEQRLLLQKIELFVEDQHREPGDIEELFGQLALSGSNLYPEYLVRILNRAGQATEESASLENLITVKSFPYPGQGETPSKLMVWHASNGKVFLLQSVESRSADGGELHLLQVAMDISGDRLLVSEYRRGLTLVTLLGLGLLTAIGYGATRRGLRPLLEIGQKIRAFGPDQLHQRLQGDDLPPELHEIAGGFNDLLGRLDDSFKKLSRFSADLAHELRTPIHNLRIQADVILARPRKAAEYRQTLESALEEYARLTRMTESLLFLARSENKSQQVMPEPVEIHKKLLEAKKRFQALAKSRRLALSVQGKSTISLDPLLLSHALSNLIVNACEHTPEGGSILLSTRMLPGGKGAEIVIKDTGEGIPSHHLPQLFDRFYRVETSRRSGQGTGLGLSMVKTVVDLHGGKISIKSEVGRGTEVTLAFPELRSV